MIEAMQSYRTAIFSVENGTIDSKLRFLLFESVSLFKGLVLDVDLLSEPMDDFGKLSFLQTILAKASRLQDPMPELAT